MDATTKPPKTTPSDEQMCYRCRPEDDCFANGDGNGDPVLCEAELFEGCYKEQKGNYFVGKIIFIQ